MSWMELFRLSEPFIRHSHRIAPFDWRSFPQSWFSIIWLFEPFGERVVKWNAIYERIQNLRVVGQHKNTWHHCAEKISRELEIHENGLVNWIIDLISWYTRSNPNYSKNWIEYVKNWFEWWKKNPFEKCDNLVFRPIRRFLGYVV